MSLLTAILRFLKLHQVTHLSITASGGSQRTRFDSILNRVLSTGYPRNLPFLVRAEVYEYFAFHFQSSIIYAEELSTSQGFVSEIVWVLTNKTRFSG